MPYRFLSKDSSVEAGLRRIATEQVDKALVALETSGEARAQGVHELRKACKKLRGLLRIVRPSFTAYSRENAALRDIAALLGPLRDSGVKRHTLDAVIAENAAAIDETAIAPIRDALAGHGRAEFTDEEVDVLFHEARSALHAARARIALWTLADDGWDALGPGIAMSYSRARKTGARARKKPDPERHHEWRKRIKDHWYHARLIRDIGPEGLKERAEEMHALARMLGDHHDCHVLEETLTAEPDAFRAAATFETLVSLAARRRARLEESAHALGARLLAANAEDLLDRWEVSWDTWRHGGAGQRTPGGR